jgi:hypothetical protein
MFMLELGTKNGEKKMPESDFQRKVDHFEFNSKVSSKYLSHFTPNFNTLLKIVESGFRPSECDEFQIYKKDYLEIEALKSWYSALAGGESEIEAYSHKIPMVCFCDIPYNIGSKHRRRYGLYSIVLKKEWAISKGLSPIIYVPKDSKVHVILKNIDSLNNRLLRVSEISEIPEIIQINQQLGVLFEFIKPYINANKDYKFYDEREWRYTPPSMIEYDPNDSTQYLKFKKEDFLFAIVRSVKEQHLLLQALRERFGYVSSKRVKIKQR